MADVTRRQLRQGAGKPQATRSKYHAVKTTVDGIRFDSAKEARRYGELKLMEKAGEIHCLILQPKFNLFALSIYGKVTDPIGVYRADFSYCTCKSKTGCEDKLVMEDVKGFKTPLYRWKKKHVEAQYGIQIREV